MSTNYRSKFRVGVDWADKGYVNWTGKRVTPFLAGFSVSIDELKVTISDESSGDNRTYSYNMGDGTILTSQNPEHTYSSDGTYSIVQTITNVDGTRSASASQRVEVERDTQPVLPSVSDKSATQNTIYSLTLPEATGGNDPLTYALVGTLPTGLTFNASTRVLSGTPTQSGTFLIIYTVTDDDGDFNNINFNLVIAVDLMPVLSSIPDQDATENQSYSYTLPITLSGDLPLVYSLTGTLPTGITYASGSRVLSGTPTQTGTFTLTYTVTDVDGDSDSDIFTLTVAADLMPTLPSIPDQNATENQSYTVTLPEATGGDTPLVYSLTGTLPTGITYASGSRVLSGTPTQTGTFILTYRVSDADGDLDSDVFILTIAADLIPSIPSISNQDATENQSYSYTLPTALSGDLPLVYSLTGTLPTGITYASGSRVLSGTPTQTGTFTLTYTVTDVDGDSDSDIFTLTVAADLMPTLPSIPDQNATENQSYTVTLPEATGGDTPLVYSLTGTLPTGITYASSSRVLSGTPTQTGTFILTYRVSDADGDLDSIEFNLVVSDIVVDLMPVLSSIPDQDATENQSYSYTLPITLSGDTPLVYSLTGTLPTGITYASGSRVLSGTPTQTGTFTLTYTVTDVDGDSDSDIFTLTVAADLMPTLPSIPDQNATENQSYTVTLPEATGGDTPLVYSLTGTLPTGITYASSSRVLSGTPTQTGTFTLTYRVSDADGDLDSDVFILTIAADLIPSIPSISNQDATENQSYSYTLPTALSGDLPLVYSLTGTLPTGITYASGSRVLSGTPTQTGTFTLTYTVTDVDGDSDSDIFTLTVAADLMPTLPSIPDQNATENQSYTVTLPEATGGDTPLVYSLTGTLPTGITYASSSRVLSGTPTQTGTFTLTYRVSDADGDLDSDVFILTIAAADLMPILPSIPNQNTNESEVYNYTLPEATGGDTPLVYTLTGTLPTGLSFNSNTRVLSGTPTQTGTFALVYTVTDVDGDIAVSNLSLTVARYLNLGSVPTGLNEDARFIITVEKSGSFLFRRNYSESDLGSIETMDANLPPEVDRIYWGESNDTLRFNAAGDDSRFDTYTNSASHSVYIVYLDSNDNVVLKSFTYVSHISVGGGFINWHLMGDLSTYFDAIATNDRFLVIVAKTDSIQFEEATTLPVIADQSATFNTSFTVTLPEALTGNTPIVYSLTGLPSWATFNSSTRVLSGTPDDNGSWTLVYTATDRDDDVATQSFNLSVATTSPDTPAAPTLTVGNNVINGVMTDPSNTGSGAINLRQYRLKRTIYTLFNPARNITDTSPPIEFTASSLTNGQAYEVQVRVRNNDGLFSNWSASSNATPSGVPAGLLADFAFVTTGTNEIYNNSGLLSGSDPIIELPNGTNLTFTRMFWATSSGQNNRKPNIQGSGNWSLIPNQIANHSFYIWHNNILYELTVTSNIDTDNNAIKWSSTPSPSTQASGDTIRIIVANSGQSTIVQSYVESQNLQTSPQQQAMDHYDNITKYVLDADWQLGVKDYYDYLAHEGTLDIVLNNESRIFSPNNSDSVLYGMLKQNLLVKLDIWHVSDEQWVSIWTGFTNEFEIDVGLNSKRNARMKCKQGIYSLREGLFTWRPQKNLNANQILRSLISMSDAKFPNIQIWALEDESREQYEYVGEGWGVSTKLEAAIKNVLEAEHGRLWYNRSGSLEFRNRDTMLNYGQDAVTIDVGNTNGATYVYSSEIINEVEVFINHKLIEEMVVWSSKGYIYVPANGASEPVLLNFEFEEGSPRSVDNQNLNIGDVVITSYRLRPMQDDVTNLVDYATHNLVLSLKDDGGGRTNIILTNSNSYDLYAKVTDIKGETLRGGNKDSFLFKNKDSIATNDLIKRKIITSPLITKYDQARALASVFLVRDSDPSGEFKNIDYISNNADTNDIMLDMTLGETVILKENLSGEEGLYHVILGEKGSIIGTHFKLSYTLARMNTESFGRIGRSLPMKVGV